MTPKEVKKYIKTLAKTSPPFVTKEGLPSWLEKAYIDGYNKAINDSCEMNTCTLEELNKIPIYFKIPMTTHYSGELSEFDEKVTYVVEGTEFCETDKFGDKCCCWYVSTIFGTSNNKEWLLKEIAELGYIPTILDFKKGLFKDITK